MTSSVILIGMPGSGKSTLGVLLAKELGLDFVDTDVAIQVREQQTLQQILDEMGYLALRDIEERIVLHLKLANKVIATGGSVVYGANAMARLCDAGTIVYLKADITTLEQRIHNYQTRGIAKRPGQSFAELFAERTSLYEQYADITIDCSHSTPEALVDQIIARLPAGDSARDCGANPGAS